uniref:PX domain-containing protein n=1 Tax=Hemiselmis andersenii TaxID=464988 RepID=A0A6U4LX31_HEMAN|mmetsp:Transcript_19835/g.45660  ORF Transcript_19835/g.45660 Transcript_19835/m.45660 type:complete len:176 (+) Transcript_19835:265-792(+)
MPPKRNMVNSEGEAQAQFRDSDFVFEDTKGKMIGSEGQIINVSDPNYKAEPPKQFKATLGGTTQKEETWMMMSSPYTVYGFNITFGKRQWETTKRYSDFDKLDNRLNDKFGLPPVGLPPKKWFGATDAETVDMRHKMLLAYLNDCIKRPVLIHSRELQNFCEMPADVIEAVSKGG